MTSGQNPGTEAKAQVGPVGTTLAFLVPALTLAVVWVIMSFMMMIGANGVMKKVDELLAAYLIGTLTLLIACVLASGFGSRALARSGRMPLWGAILLTTALSAITETVGACVVFGVSASALGIM
jgi:hypothetical protein